MPTGNNIATRQLCSQFLRAQYLVATGHGQKFLSRDPVTPLQWSLKLKVSSLWFSWSDSGSSHSMDGILAVARSLSTSKGFPVAQSPSDAKAERCSGSFSSLTLHYSLLFTQEKVISPLLMQDFLSNVVCSPNSLKQHNASINYSSQGSMLLLSRGREQVQGDLHSEPDVAPLTCYIMEL